MLESAFNSDNVRNGKGMVVAKNIRNEGLSFILRQVYFIDNLASFSFTALTSEDNSCPKAEGALYRNCAVVQGPLKDGEIYTGNRYHFFSGFKINFCLWIMVCFTLAYFIWALGSSTNDPLLHNINGNSWYNSALYSAYNFGNPRQTKVSRITSILVTIGGHLIGCALIYMLFRKYHHSFQIPVAIAAGMSAGWILQRIGSFFLMGLMSAHYKYLDEIKTANTHDQKEEILDRYDNRRLTWNYLFYWYSFLVWMGACWGSIAFLINFTNYEFWWFMLSFGICLVGEFIVFDTIQVLLGKGTGCLARLVQARGYYIDYDLHHRFEEHLSAQD